MKHLIILFLLANTFLLAQNPIIPNQGINDPHIRIFNNKAYLSASHDKSPDNTKFIMEEWVLYSSDDLINWHPESTLKPIDTYIGKEFNRCWATDIALKNGKYYWYFSEGNQQTGVVVGDSPSGPWIDPLNKPLLNSELTPTHEYDPGIFQGSSGDYYIIFGVWDYYIAKLNEDMISLAEEPRKITINNPRGPYNPDGNNMDKPTDDKPFLHSYKGKYYLSWGCFYAMSDNLYGPYEYKGTVIDSSSFAHGYDSPTWPNGFLQGRHGSFFEWHNQWYFAYCDISQTGNRYFRDTFLSYVHYKANGEIAVIRIDGTGVANYSAMQIIEAEDYFKASQEVIKFESGDNTGFNVSIKNDGDYLIYSNIDSLDRVTQINLAFKSLQSCEIELRFNSNDGELIQRLNPKDLYCSFPLEYNFENGKKYSLCMVFKGTDLSEISLDYISFN